MRKHFLILMLLALLPLAGFAADFNTEATVTVGDKYFGIAPAKANVTVVVNSLVVDAAKWDIDETAGKVNYYTDATCTVKADLAEGKLTPNVGTYYLKIVPADTDNSGFAAGKIIVRPMPLKLTVANAAKTYGQPDPASYTISTLLDNGDNDVKAALASKVTVIRETGENVKAGGYNFSPSTISDGNYMIGTATGTFTINTKTFVRGTGAGTVTITVSDNVKTYSGVAQHPTIVIHDNDYDVDLAPEDFEVSYAAGNINVTAGSTITVTGKRNYNATPLALDGATDKKLVINKKELSIFVDDLTKVYDGTETIPAVTFSYSGLVGADLGKTQPFGDNFEPVYATATGSKKEAGKSYPLKAQVKGAADFGGTTWGNYDPIYPTIGQMTVNKRPVTITVGDYERSYGDEDEAGFTGYTVEAAGVDKGAVAVNAYGASTDKAWMEASYDVTRVDGFTTNEVGVYPEKLTVSLKSNADANAKKAIANYDITIVKGKFTILAAALIVTPKKVAITYGEEYDINKFEVIATNSTGTRVTLTSTPKVKFLNDEYNTKNPTAAGVYTLVLDGDIAADGYDGEAAVRNEGQLIINKKALNIQMGAQTLMIGDGEDALLAKAVKFVDAQGKNGLVGDDKIGFDLAFNTTVVYVDGLVPTQDNAAQAAVDVDDDAVNDHNARLNGAVTVGDAAPDDYVTKVGVAPVDAASLTVDEANAYNATLEGAATVGVAIPETVVVYDAATTHKLVAQGDGIFAKGVKIIENGAVEGCANANYELDFNVFGVLTVLTDAELALNSNDIDLVNINKKNNQVIAGPIALDLNPRQGQELPAGTVRTWAAKQWNTLVLPFDITVAELSHAFGYAIVNVVDAAKTTANNVQFKLEMDEIPANTPFTIKTAKDLADIDGGLGAGIIVFDNGHTVVAPTASNMAGVDAGMGYKFIPVYETMTVDKTMSNYRFLLGNYAKWAYITESSANTWDLVPFTAYIDLSAAAAPEQVTFTFQELDGSTTTIKAIESGLIDGSVKGYTMEGWYNLNGVKLEGVPTQKGIYINNGKKVVIK